MPKTKPLSEHAIQCIVFRWIRGDGILVFPELGLCRSSTTGQNKTKRQASWFSAEGMETGYPDIILSIPRCGYSSLHIELKKPPAKVREDQAFRIFCLRQMGSAAVVRYTANDVISTLIDYLLNNGVYEPDQFLEYIPWEQYRKKSKKKNGSNNQKTPHFRNSQLYQHWQFCRGRVNL